MKKLLVSLVSCQLAGFIGSLFTSKWVSSNWYLNLDKPALMPRPWIFATVWLILYLLMGLALYLIWKKTLENKKASNAVVLFFVHLIFNTAWSFIFFQMQNLFVAFIDLVILWIFVVLLIIRFYKLDKRAAYLLIPYLIWASFAGYLNFSIWESNKLHIAVKNNVEISMAKNSSPSTPENRMIDGDVDTHGCLIGAGYSWCDPKQKCLRVWEELCITSEEQVSLEKQIKEQIVLKRGKTAENLTIKLQKIDGNYAQGSASVPSAGGGMWFSAKTDNEWKLIWDGNGSILCSDLTDYPNFSASLIPECLDKTTRQMVQRQ